MRIIADISHHPGMVGVVPAVGGEVERHAHSLLAGGQVATVEGVGLFGGREPGVLADGPGPIGVHGGPHAALERRDAGQRVERFEVLEVGRRVQRLDRNPFGRVPHQTAQVVELGFLLGQLLPIGHGGRGELVQHVVKGNGRGLRDHNEMPAGDESVLESVIEAPGADTGGSRNVHA